MGIDKAARYIAGIVEKEKASSPAGELGTLDLGILFLLFHHVLASLVTGFRILLGCGRHSSRYSDWDPFQKVTAVTSIYSLHTSTSKVDAFQAG